MRRVYKNLSPAIISASIMAANMWKNSLKGVESDNNKILYEILLEFFTVKRYLLFRISLIRLYLLFLIYFLFKIVFVFFLKLHQYELT